MPIQQNHYKTVKNMKNICYKTIISLKFYRILIPEEGNSQLKYLTSQGHLASQYQGHLQVTKFQAFNDQTMPNLP